MAGAAYCCGLSAPSIYEDKRTFDDFARAFYQSDVLVVLPIYSAGEKSIEGIDGHGICKAIRAHGHREVVFSEGSEAVLYLQKNLKRKISS